MLWKYVLCYLNNENYCLINTTKHPLNNLEKKSIKKSLVTYSKFEASFEFHMGLAIEKNILVMVCTTVPFRDPHRIYRTLKKFMQTKT